MDAIVYPKRTFVFLMLYLNLYKKKKKNYIPLLVCREDISRFEYLPLFIKEVMRMFTTVPIIARKHSSPVTIDGVEIPTGPRIDINLHVVHHCFKGWKNSEVRETCVSDILRFLVSL